MFVDVGYAGEGNQLGNAAVIADKKVMSFLVLKCAA